MEKREPDPEEMPPEMGDMLEETRTAFEIYNYLPEKWGDYAGNYFGKDITSLPILYDLFEIEDNATKRHLLLIIKIIDNHVIDLRSEKLKHQMTKTAKGR